MKRKIKSSVTISVVVPAYNEERNLAPAIGNLLKALKSVDDYEIIIFDDRSSDQTGEIADILASKNRKIKVVHNKRNMGFGYNCVQGYKLSSMQYCTLFPGDNENSWESLAEQIRLIGQAEIITSYTINPEVRTFSRRFISNAFTNLMNFLFGMKMKYFNGITIYPSALLKNLDVKTYGFAYNSEILIKLIKSGHSYTEYGVKIGPTKKTNLFKLKNIIRVLETIIRLFYEIRIRNKRTTYNSL